MVVVPPLTKAMDERDEMNRRQAEERIQAEADARRQAEARIRELEAELDRVRGTAPESDKA